MKKLTLLLFAFNLILTSCNIKPIELIKIENFKIQSFNTQGAVVEVQARIKNPNSFGFTLRESKLTLYMDNNELGDVFFKDAVKIKRNEEASYVFILKSDLAKLAGNGLVNSISLLFKDRVTLQIKGNLKARAFLISTNQKIDIKEDVSPQKLLGQ